MTVLSFLIGTIIGTHREKVMTQFIDINSVEDLGESKKPHPTEIMAKRKYTKKEKPSVTIDDLDKLIALEIEQRADSRQHTYQKSGETSLLGEFNTEDVLGELRGLEKEQRSLDAVDNLGQTVLNMGSNQILPSKPKDKGKGKGKIMEWVVREQDEDSTKERMRLVDQNGGIKKALDNIDDLSLVDLKALGKSYGVPKIGKLKGNVYKNVKSHLESTMRKNVSAINRIHEYGDWVDISSSSAVVPVPNKSVAVKPTKTNKKIQLEYKKASVLNGNILTGNDDIDAIAGTLLKKDVTRDEKRLVKNRLDALLKSHKITERTHKNLTKRYRLPDEYLSFHNPKTNGSGLKRKMRKRK